jgi:NAD(P)-dependent dehydrogenase (short-subunit alcohol dehydrogenase family)
MANPKALRTTIPSQLRRCSGFHPHILAASQIRQRYDYYLFNSLSNVSGQLILFTHPIRTMTGRIINVGSLAGGHNDPEPGLSIYSGTKHAVEGLSEALRFELARVGVEVSLIQPDGSFLDKCLFDQHHK